MGKLLAVILILFTISAKSQETLDKTSTDKPATQLNKTPEALGISAKVQQAVKGLANPPINIALFGVDRRNAKEDKANSDVIMIISFDPISGKVKMSSIMRDTYVKIEGIGMNKINDAFAAGGPQLAIKTINQNFDLDIKDYLNVDFYSAAKIVDALNGVEINVKPEEIRVLNKYLDELINIGEISAQHVNTSGLQRLDGNQTVAYTRIRSVGHGDYERTERQRAVLIALFNKIKTSGSSLLPVFTSQILPNIETSMNNMALFSFANGILNSNNKVIEQARFPLDTQSEGKRINNIWYLTTDLKVTTTAIHNFIYKDIKPANKK
jgi:LCP family protein required for cell wall assembly